MEDKPNVTFSPSAFYRKLRPYNFSDSDTDGLYELPRELLKFELDQITTNQKESDFERLCIRLSEKCICPNLIPQVGPTGGGDGKTDTETYPVSQFISDRWFIPDNDWTTNQKWAFAFSAKKDWRAKLKSDFEKIIATDRDYTKIFFITNQAPSSKQKKSLQDDYMKKYNIELVILDREWILEKIYSSNLQNLVVNTLNLSPAYKQNTRLGPNDLKRQQELDEIEGRINNPSRYSQYDFQLVNDALESAILSRQLERPRDEVEGRFDRVRRFCEQLNAPFLWRKYHYQRAWTYFIYYEDYPLFLQEFKNHKKFLSKIIYISETETYFTLLPLLKALSKFIDLSKYDISYIEEKNDLLNVLNSYINASNSTSSIAQTDIDLLNLLDAEDNLNKASLLVSLRKNIVSGCQKPEYPFVKYLSMIEQLGSMFCEFKEYDDLIGALASIAEKRTAEKSAAIIFLKTGIQKFKKELYKDSIIFFGRTLLKLSKEETKEEMISALIGLGYSYRNLGLLWASNNCFATAIYFSLKCILTDGKIDSRTIKLIYAMIENELLIGRIPNLLAWYEMYSILNQKVASPEEPYLSDIDTFLAIRLLNSSFDDICKHSYLPDVLFNLDLVLSEQVLLYLLGHEDKIPVENSNPDYCYNMLKQLANQPFKEQLLFKTNFGDGEKSIFCSKILGCTFEIEVDNNAEMILFSEMLLAFLESFFSTSMQSALPTVEKLHINIVKHIAQEAFSFFKLSKSYSYQIAINEQIFSDKNCNYLHEPLISFVATVLIDYFCVKSGNEYLENLFKKEELLQRSTLILSHFNVTKNIFGNRLFFTLKDWIDRQKVNTYPVKRKNKISFFDNSSNPLQEKRIENNLDQVRHDKMQVVSLINNELWDKANWEKFGFMYDLNYGLGVLLCFNYGEYGKCIFQEWIERLGNTDQEELLKISIIRGVSKTNPHWYRVLITCDEKNNYQTNSSNWITSTMRYMNVTPQNSNNIEQLARLYDQTKEYKLYPAEISNSEEGIKPYLDLGIHKRKLKICFANELKKDDFEYQIIKKCDDL
ncbi:MAG: hypothetical protein AB1454_02170 [Candidatus Auribacterota bacterium]